MASSSLLRALGNAPSIARGKMAHAKMIVFGFLPDVILSNHLMTVYVRCGRADDARRAFDQMPEKNVVSWTILISGYARLGPVEEAVSCFRSMVAAGSDPNDFTYASVLSACASIGAAGYGKEIHGRIYRVERGASSSHVSNSLVNLYAKCGMMPIARRVFDGILQPSLVSWGSILAGYCQSGGNEEALKLFLRAQKENVRANEYLVTSVLSACAGLGDSVVGEQVHCQVVKSGSGSDQFVEAGIIHMYMKCGELEAAHQAFSELDNPGLASSAAMIGGYTKQGQGEKALDLFRELHSSCLKPNEHILPSVLVACSAAGAVEGGAQLHSLIIKLGYKMAAHVGNAVMDFYARCGLLNESSKIFQEMEERDVVSWNAMAARNIDRGDFKGAMDLMKHMLLEGIDPNLYTYSTILSLCAHIPAIGWGQQTHAHVIKPRLDARVVVGSALIDMYAKCGRLSDARKVFNRLPLKNLVSWNGMLVGYAQHGFGKEALEIFSMMQREGIKPNDVTFLGVLSACSHVGFVEEGLCHFDLMKEYGIIPRMDHFACMVDLLARAGQIKKAFEFISKMSIEPNKVIWRSLFAGCRTHGYSGTGMVAAKNILEIDPQDVPAHVMLSGVYAEAGMWGERAEVRENVKTGSRKVPGCSWIEVKNKIHCFFAGDAAEGHWDYTSEILNRLVVHMVDTGYTPEAVIFQHEEQDDLPPSIKR